MAQMQILAFLDLDDSLFQTRPKCPPGATLSPGALARDGTALSFMTEKQKRFFDLLDETATIIPTTARNRDAFLRVQLPFRSYAILNFGGVVLLPDGSLDQQWDVRIRSRSLALQDSFLKLHQQIETFNETQSLGVRTRIISDFDMPLYIVSKHPGANLSALDAIQNDCLPGLDLSGFFIHRNHNNLSLVPEFLGKEFAVKHILDTYFSDIPVMTLGLGDSRSDAGFVKMCDFAMMPGQSQLASDL